MSNAKNERDRRRTSEELNNRMVAREKPVPVVCRLVLWCSFSFRCKNLKSMGEMRSKTEKNPYRTIVIKKIRNSIVQRYFTY